jgi:hypothetical protein
MKVITYGGIEWEATTPTSEWYYHGGEGAVFPWAQYHKHHSGHCVLPVKPRSITPKA